jgi:hypothetical protein
MNATRPEADTEYSRGDRASEGNFGARGRRLGDARGASSRLLWIVLGGGLLGSALLLVAEFTPLLAVHSSAYGAAVQTERTGAHQSYALIPVAVSAAVLTIAAVRSGSGVALAGVGAMGLVALSIALLGDLPDAQATGFVGNSQTSLTPASSSPGAGLYLETLGAIVLLITAAAGLLLPAPGGRAARRPVPRPND